jgi:aryl carrier-like protein
MGMAMVIGWNLFKRLHAPTAGEIADELAHRGNRQPATNVIREVMHEVLNGTAARIERMEKMLQDVKTTQAADSVRMAKIEERLKNHRDRIDQLTRAARAKGMLGP